LWWTGVFAGGFGEKACFVVVFLWSICGALRGERGGLAATFFRVRKIRQLFEVYFLIFLIGLFPALTLPPLVLPDGPPARRAAISWFFFLYCRPTGLCACASLALFSARPI
jgi:hypothetical protein